MLCRLCLVGDNGLPKALAVAYGLYHNVKLGRSMRRPKSRQELSDMWGYLESFGKSTSEEMN